MGAFLRDARELELAVIVAAAVYPTGERSHAWITGLQPLRWAGDSPHETKGHPMFKTTHAPCSLGVDGMALLGRTVHDLRGFRFAEAGGGGDGAPAVPPGTTPSPAAEPPKAEPPATEPPKGGEPPKAEPPKDGDPITAPVGGVPFNELPAETQTEVRRLRTRDREATQQRTEWEQAGITPERRKELGKLLGYEKDETPDVAALTGSVAALTTRAETAEERAVAAERANMVLLEAPDAGGNAKLLLDSNGFTATIKALDAPDQAAIQNAIKTWVAAHPEHAARPTGGLPAASGGRQQGASGLPAKTGLEGAVAKQLGQ